jgi:hypothetical protein
MVKMLEYIGKTQKLDNISTLCCYIINSLICIIIMILSLTTSLIESSVTSKIIYTAIAGICLALNICLIMLVFYKAKNALRYTFLLVYSYFLTSTIIANVILRFILSSDAFLFLALQEVTSLILYLKRYFSLKLSENCAKSYEMAGGD